MAREGYRRIASASARRKRRAARSRRKWLRSAASSNPTRSRGSRPTSRRTTPARSRVRRSCSTAGRSCRRVRKRKTGNGKRKEPTMKTEEFLDALDALVAEKHLLKHPFYTLWSEGKLTRDHIREYAVSYYPHVAAFPTYVSGVHSGCDDPRRCARSSSRTSSRKRAVPSTIPRSGAASPRSRRVGSRPFRVAPDRRGRGRDRGIPPDDAGVRPRGARRALRLRVADSRDLEDEARGAPGVLRDRRSRSDAVLHRPRGSRRVAPPGRAAGPRPRGADRGGPRERARRGGPLPRRVEPGRSTA